MWRHLLLLQNQMKNYGEKFRCVYDSDLLRPSLIYGSALGCDPEAPKKQIQRCIMGLLIKNAFGAVFQSKSCMTSHLSDHVDGINAHIIQTDFTCYIVYEIDLIWCYF